MDAFKINIVVKPSRKLYRKSCHGQVTGSIQSSVAPASSSPPRRLRSGSVVSPWRRTRAAAASAGALVDRVLDDAVTNGADGGNAAAAVTVGTGDQRQVAMRLYATAGFKVVSTSDIKWWNGRINMSLLHGMRDVRMEARLDR